MANECYEGHRVRHLRDGLVGTVTSIERSVEASAVVGRFTVRWDNGSLESRIDPSEVAPEISG